MTEDEIRAELAQLEDEQVGGAEREATGTRYVAELAHKNASALMTFLPAALVSAESPSTGGAT